MNYIQTVGRQCLWSFIIYLLLIVQDIFENYYFNKRELNEPTYFSYDRHGKNSLLLWGEISHAHILNSQSPVSGLQTDLFTARSLFVNKWLRYQDAFILYSWLPCITDTRYWRVLLQENCAVNILFCLYCWQINVLNVLFMRPFIKIFDFELMRKEQRTEEKNRTKLTLFNS